MEPTYDPKKSLDKGVDAGTTATVGGAVLTLVQVGVAVSQGATVSEAVISAGVSAAMTLIVAGVSGFRAWRKNRKKHKKAERYYSQSGYLLAVAGLAGLLSGCITTTAPDGTVTQQVDGVLLETMLTRYDRYVARQELLQIEREKARRANDAAMMAIVQAELDKLEPEIARLAERLGLAAEN